MHINWGIYGLFRSCQQLNELEVVFWIQRLRKLHAQELFNSYSSLVFIDPLQEKVDELFLSSGIEGHVLFHQSQPTFRKNMSPPSSGSKNKPRKKPA
jgi:hypothetical protein